MFILLLYVQIYYKNINNLHIYAELTNSNNAYEHIIKNLIYIMI